jgi:hypothetical protein
MSYGDFPSQLYFMILNAGTNSLGSFQLGSECQLRNLVFSLLKVGTLGGSERLRLKLYTDSGLTELYKTGSWASLASISGISASAWLGWLRLDFSDIWVAGSQTFYLAVETDGYTANYPTMYLGLKLDWPYAVNEKSGLAHPVEFAAYVLKESSR